MRSLSTCLLDCVREGRPIADLPIVDVHGHLGEYRQFPVFGSTAADLVGQMDRLGIDRLIVSHHLVVFHGGPDADEPVLAAMRAHPGRIYGYCCPDPRIPGTGASYVERRLEQGFVGIKLHDYRGLPYTARALREIYSLAVERRIPVLFHSAGNQFRAGFGSVLEAFPDLVCILAHGGAGYPQYTHEALDEDAAFVRSFPGAHLDFSAAISPPAYPRAMVEKLGADRVLFGSDMPFVSGAYTLGCMAALDLDDARMHEVLHGNAERLFGRLMRPT
jgi:predicted TIM-barrel fold metal-dependent hydrolase